MADITVQDDPDESRYVVLVDGEIGGMLGYTRVADGTTLDLVHTVILPSHRGQGLAGELAAQALDDIRARGERAIASCSFLKGWLPDHPQYQDLFVG